jgi:hypothetical protein
MIFTIAGGLVVIACIVVFVLWPLAGQLEVLHGKVQSQRDQYNQLVLEEISYRNAAREFARIKTDVGEIQALFPPKEQLVGFIERLELIAREFENNFTMTITDADENQPATKDKKPAQYAVVPGLKNLDVIPYDFKLSGSFLSMVRFLQTLENQSFNSEIESFQLHSDQAASASVAGLMSRTGRVAAEIRAAFYAKQDKK